MIIDSCMPLCYERMSFVVSATQALHSFASRGSSHVVACPHRALALIIRCSQTTQLAALATDNEGDGVVVIVQDKMPIKLTARRLSP